MPKKYCFIFGFAANKSSTDMSSKQETENQMVLGYLITSQGKPKVGVLCTVLDSDVRCGHHWLKQYIKRQLCACYVKLSRHPESFGLLFLV